MFFQNVAVFVKNCSEVSKMSSKLLGPCLITLATAYTLFLDDISKPVFSGVLRFSGRHSLSFSGQNSKSVKNPTKVGIL